MSDLLNGQDEEKTPKGLDAYLRNLDKYRPPKQYHHAIEIDEDCFHKMFPQYKPNLI